MTSVLIESMADLMTGNGPKCAKVEKAKIIRVVPIREEGRRLQYAGRENNLTFKIHQVYKGTSFPGGL